MLYGELNIFLDARTLVDHARVEAQNHTFTYDEVKFGFCLCVYVVG